MSDKDTFKIEVKRSNMLLYFYYVMLVISIIWVIAWGVLLEEARGSGSYGGGLSNYGVVDAIEAGAYMILGAIFIHLFAMLIYKEYFKRQIKGMASKNT